MASDKPAKQLVAEVCQGDEGAAEEIWCRYSQQLLTLVEEQIGRRLQSRIGPEDIVQSVFRSFFRRVGEGQFSIDHSGALWRLLVAIARHKVAKQVEFHQADRRDTRREIPAFDLDAIARPPTEQEVSQLRVEFEALLSHLYPPGPDVLRMRLQGYSTSEIATQLECTRWTVRRFLSRIERQLQMRLNDSLG